MILTSPAVFDPKKLEWMNGEHMKRLGPARLVSQVFQPSDAVDQRKAEAIVAAVLPRSWTLLDVRRQARLRAGLDPVVLDEKAQVYIGKNPDAYRQALEKVEPVLSQWSDWTISGIDTTLRAVASASGMKIGEIMQPVRIAVTGSTVSEPVTELLAVMPKDVVLKRLRAAAAG